MAKFINGENIVHKDLHSAAASCFVASDRLLNGQLLKYEQLQAIVEQTGMLMLRESQGNAVLAKDAIHKLQRAIEDYARTKGY